MLRLALLAALAAFAHGLTVPSVRTTPVASPRWAPVKLDAKAWVGPAAATFAAVTSPAAALAAASADTCGSECGTVDAPGWVLPLGAVLVIGTSLLPLALKDGEEAFDDIKERDSGFFGKTRGD